MRNPFDMTRTCVHEAKLLGVAVYGALSIGSAFRASSS
jgi:hypothetical protein